VSDLDASSFELFGHCPQCVLVGDLPAEIVEIIFPCRVDEETMVIIIYAEEESTVVSPSANLHP
jgi:hypothetical protein